MLKKLFVLLLAISLIGCSDNDSDVRKNGFIVDGKFYETPYGGYFNLRAPDENNFYVLLTDNKLWLNDSGGMELSDIKNTTLTSFEISLILPGANAWEGEYIYSKTQNKSQCASNFGYWAKQPFDSDSYPIDPPQPYPNPFPDIHSGVVEILSKEGNDFEIEYEVVFNEGNRHVTGYFKGSLLFQN